MRILMFVSNDVTHDPRVLKEARALIAAGHEVTAIGWDRTGSAHAREERGGLRIFRVKTSGPMRLLWKDLIRNPIWWRRAARLARSLEFDAIHCHDLDTLPIGVRLKDFPTASAFAGFLENLHHLQHRRLRFGRCPVDLICEH